MKYCLLGEKLGHSYSREIHKEMGFDYSLVEVAKKDLERFFKTTEYDGFNITIPYKVDALKYVKNLTPVAKMAGSINTVKVVNGEFYGHNTDVDGMNYMITRKGVSLKGKRVMILGSGGTSNTAVTLCKRENALSVTVVSRTGEVNYQNCYDYLDTEIIINATPVGMYPNVENSPITLSKFKNLIAVFDCIYNPFKTELLLQAEELGVINSNGLSMLVKQAILAEDFWQGVDSGNAKTEQVIKKLTVSKSNVVLFGMPSSGKSTIGKKVAEILNRDFIDTDDYILKITGESPSKIINERGIDEFRRIETEAVKEVVKLSGKVISLGGGAVLKEENRNAIKRNSVAVYIKRDLKLLEVSGRPLSLKLGVEALYNERKDIYESVKDCEIENNGDVQTAVNGVIKEYENTCNKRC